MCIHMYIHIYLWFAAVTYRMGSKLATTTRMNVYIYCNTNMWERVKVRETSRE